MTRTRAVPALLALALVGSSCGGTGPENPLARGVTTTGSPSTTVATDAADGTVADPSTTTATTAPTTTAATGATTPPTATTTTFAPRGTFRVVVIVDVTSEQVTLDQAQALVTDASTMHQRLSGFSVEMVDYVQASPGPIPNGAPDSRDLDQLVYDYEAAHFPDMPDGFMIFSFGHDGSAASFGGYTYTLPARPGHEYRFVATNQPGPLYHIGVVHFDHRYASCGYGPDPMDRLGQPTQDTSFGGECRNQDGVQCVEHNGYSMCITATGDLYASTITYFAASTLVHETMHNFGVDVATDHFGTQSCTDAMVALGSTRGYEPNSLPMSQEYSGICPFLYDRFIDAYVGN